MKLNNIWSWWNTRTSPSRQYLFAKPGESFLDVLNRADGQFPCPHLTPSQIHHVADRLAQGKRAFVMFGEWTRSYEADVQNYESIGGEGK
jgi:hypothetical protein